MPYARSAAEAMRRFAALFCVTGAVAIATTTSGGATPPAAGQSSVPAQPTVSATPKPTDTPTPKPTPCPTGEFSTVGNPDLGVSLRGAGEGAMTCGMATSKLPLTGYPKPVVIDVNDKGLVVKYRFTSDTPFVTYRKLNGVPMVEEDATHPGEQRVEVTVGDPQRPDHFVTVAVNANAVCVLTGRNISDPDQHRACTAASPSPSPTPAAPAPAATAAAPSPAPTPGTTAAAKSCPADGCVLAGTVTVPLSFLGPALNTKPGPNPAASPAPNGNDGVQQFYFCYALRKTANPTFHDTTDYVNAMNDAKDPKNAANNGSCHTYGVRIVDGSKQIFRVAGSASDGNQKASSGSSGGGDTSTAGLRRALLRNLAAQGSGASTTQASGSGGNIGALVTLVHPVSFSMRASVHVQSNSLLGSIDKQTQQYLADFSAEQAQVTSSGVSFAGTPNTSDTFTKLDADILQRVIPRPYRGYQEAGAAPKSELKAFDATNLLDLKPFDPSHIKEVTYGGKLTWFPTDAAFGMGYYRDSTTGANGTILHGDGALDKVMIGVSEVVANAQKPSTNKYVTALHTANTVVGVATKYGRDDGWKSFMRFGTMATGNDWLAAISYAVPGSGQVTSFDGKTVRNSVLVGYRAIDAGYAPLATGYDIFAGNQLLFARLGSTTTRWGPKAALVYETTLSLARGANGGIPAYSSVGLTQTVPLYGGFSLDLVAARSTIAGSVVARQDGKFVVTGAAATTPLNNDTATANLSYQNDTIQLKLGESLTHSPACSSATACASPFAHALTGSASVVAGLWLINGNIQPGSTQTNNPGGTSLASNQIVRSYLAAYHVCSIFGGKLGFEPSLVYKNNISEDSSAFTPGNLIEEDVDIGNLDGAALRLSYKRAANQKWVPVPLTGKAFSFTIVSKDQTIWRTNKTLDPCIRRADKKQPNTLETSGGGSTATSKNPQQP